MMMKPIRVSIHKQRMGRPLSDRDRTYFRLPVEHAAALLSELLNAHGDDTTPTGVASSLQMGARVTDAFERDGVRWVVTGARIVEGKK